MSRPKLLVFASGTATGGGSGFEKLVEASRGGPLEADIVEVVSNHANGGVRERAERLGVPFRHFPRPQEAAEYQRIAADSGADFFSLSGWVRPVVGLDLSTRFNPKTVLNIHPALLPDFGGKGMHGHYVHEAVMAAYERGEITHSGLSMHFVIEEYDEGPVFFRCKVAIEENDTADTLAKRINAQEHIWQPRITDDVVNGRIHWDGINPASLVSPDDYYPEVTA